MDQRRLPMGAWGSLQKPQLQSVIDGLRSLGYRTVGPRAVDGAIVYDDLDSIDQLPRGLLDVQDGGRYRLQEHNEAGWFDYVVGPHSLKNYLFPPRETIQELTRDGDGWRQSPPPDTGAPLAVLGVRACDLHALRVQDRVFLEGPYVDPGYQARREALFVVAVNCRRAAATCFCHSMKTGPEVRGEFDLALTEFDDSFLLQIGSERGREVMAGAQWSPASMDEVQRAREVPGEPPAADAHPYRHTG